MFKMHLLIVVFFFWEGAQTSSRSNLDARLVKLQRLYYKKKRDYSSPKENFWFYKRLARTTKGVDLTCKLWGWRWFWGALKWTRRSWLKWRWNRKGRIWASSCLPPRPRRVQSECQFASGIKIEWRKLASIKYEVLVLQFFLI